MAAIYRWALVFITVPAIQVPAAAPAQHLNLNSLLVPERFG